jgi:MFS transporter, DHA1 family, multidrug resistance protein
VNADASPRSTSRLIVLTCLLFSVGPLTVDMSLPGLSAIQTAIGNQSVRAELTLTAVFLGMALGQFLFGAYADRYGRRVPLLVSMSIYAAASAGAAVATNIMGFGLARLVQALGYGAAVVLSRSIVVDTCDERATAKVFSIAVTVTSLATVVAPAVGGLLLAQFGWRAIPSAMAAVGGAVVIFVALVIPETLPAARRSTVGLSRLVSTYGALLKNRRFVAFALVGACAAATQFSYNTGAPAVLIEHYGLSPSACGLALSAIALSMALASQVNAVLLKWHVPRRIMKTAVVAAVLSSALLLISVFSGFGGATGLTVALLLQITMIGFIIANSMAGAMSSAGLHAGAASALLGVMMFLLGTVGSALIGVLHDSAGRLMAVVIVVFSLISVTVTLRAGAGSDTPALAREGAGAT